ncbi:nucleotide sugar dehydrogenase [Clostridium sp. YIM B02515]|uniref:Nucleotide sugar dehydrogenase n=1 Tax=Clostridium rhizosphaerae TaxID=2803861 RepID=A0ABS1TAE3_9CLOT|nr:nucleotide sugar dehydrogenase [Clostridium rhizosphaerae]MBL4936331.1 nucleotide sugar dehydrogenase [Clostridium rhizosphaerae]
MSLYNKIIEGQEKIAVIGLGYVGMPLAVSFAEKVSVIGFDINASKVEQYKNGHDITNEVGDEKLKTTTVEFTSNPSKLKEAKFYIVAVPTPINKDTTPDLTPIIGASEIVGRNLKNGSIVVFESTVYPGVTEEICLPVLEKESGLKCGVDFKIGYSPERINPGDKVHTIDKIVKVVSGMDNETLDEVAKIYELIIAAGVHRADSIKVAEAAKVIENSQRDINIAFINELSIIFNKMGIDTKAVLEAAGTKWNFINLNPGLVGGHCIGVDPYYLIYRAKQLGYQSQVISAGRRVNDSIGKYIAENTIKKLIQAGKTIKGAIVAVMGITFKENCPDIRNSKVIDIITELQEYGVIVKVYDPIVNKDEVLHEYGIKLCELEELRDLDGVIFAVSHDKFKVLDIEQIGKLYSNKCQDFEEVAATKELSEQRNNVLIDVKGIYESKQAIEKGYIYWRL